MAVLWSETIENNHYEVRQAGASVRLYRNGVHHSQFNPNRPLSGGIWDLLTITTLFRPQARIESGLILGFGAGAAGKLLQELAAPQRVVGVDLDPIHLSIADSFFGCSDGCELIAADAVQWIHETKGQASAYAKFDWVLDDLYGEDQGIPVRVGPESLDWFCALADRISEEGMLVVNLVEPDKVKTLPVMKHRELIQRFPHAMELSLPAYDNRVLAFSRYPFETKFYQQRLDEYLLRYPACRGVKSKYRLRMIKR